MGHQRRTVLLIALSAMLPSLPASARRRPPREVPPVVRGGIKYTVPHFGSLHGKQEDGGYVQAWDVKSGKLLWDRMVYRVAYEPNLEKDVQDVFIVNIRVTGKKLFVKNESNERFEMDLDGGEVRALTPLGPRTEVAGGVKVP